MLIITIALMVGASGGALAGAVAGWRVVRRQPAEPALPPNVGLDPELERRIGDAAQAWAEHHGQPDAAPLLASKLRLTYVLGRGRKRRRHWRSSW
jgi:hypothetical protein